MALVPHGGGAGGSVSMAMPMLTPDNYTVWAIKVQAILDAHTLWEAVAPGDATVNGKKCKTVRAMILGGLPEDVLLQVAMKLTAKEVWDSLKVRFVGADRVRGARRATLRGEFDRLKMVDSEVLDAYAGRLAGMTARFANLGETLGDAELVKKLLDTVPDRLFPVVTGIEKFCVIEEMTFDEALGGCARSTSGFGTVDKTAASAAGSSSHDGGAVGSAGASARRSSGQRRRPERGVGQRRQPARPLLRLRERGHFKRECPKLRRAPAAEQAMLADVGVEDGGLL
nr:uncharacterized protein LOC109745244 [Aegilops tauschii subsp. strangulata]